MSHFYFSFWSTDAVRVLLTEGTDDDRFRLLQISVVLSRRCYWLSVLSVPQKQPPKKHHSATLFACLFRYDFCNYQTKQQTNTEIRNMFFLNSANSSLLAVAIGGLVSNVISKTNEMSLFLL